MVAGRREWQIQETGVFLHKVFLFYSHYCDGKIIMTALYVRFHGLFKLLYISPFVKTEKGKCGFRHYVMNIENILCMMNRRTREE
jgi:hypothetical protein